MITGGENILRLRFPTILAICFACFLAATVSIRAQSPSAAKPAAGTPSVKTDLPLIDLDGYKKIIASYKGKPTLVTFWATWCEPCRDEYPMIVELYKQYRAQGLAVFGVNLDANADVNVMKRFLIKNNPPFPNYRQKPGIDVDAFYPGVNPQWTGTMPETIFYGRDGRIVVHMEGEYHRDDYVEAIQKILAAK
jgi:thiol-disulfide isomerase/thioredoxin